MKFLILILNIYKMCANKSSIQSNSESFYQKIWKTVCYENKNKPDHEYICLLNIWIKNVINHFLNQILTQEYTFISTECNTNILDHITPSSNLGLKVLMKSNPLPCSSVIIIQTASQQHVLLTSQKIVQYVLHSVSHVRSSRFVKFEFLFLLGARGSALQCKHEYANILMTMSERNCKLCPIPPVMHNLPTNSLEVLLPQIWPPLLKCVGPCVFTSLRNEEVGNLEKIDRWLGMIKSRVSRRLSQIKFCTFGHHFTLLWQIGHTSNEISNYERVELLATDCLQALWPWDWDSHVHSFSSFLKSKNLTIFLKYWKS